MKTRLTTCACAAMAAGTALCGALDGFETATDLPGAVLLVWTGRETLVETAGYADLKTKRPSATNDLYWIASNTKAIACALALRYVDRGLIGLDDPVAKYIPSWKDIRIKGGAKPSHAPTVREVMGHTGGLAFFPKDSPITRYSVAELAELAAQEGLDHDVGPWAYSNWGIDVAMAVVERVAGAPWEKLLETEVLAPLGMTETTFFPSEELCRTRLAKSYRLDEKKPPEEMTVDQLVWPYDKPGTHAEAGGGLFSTGPDLLKFARMLAEKGRGPDGRTFISERLMNEWYGLTPAYEGRRYTFGLNVSAEVGCVGHGGAYDTQAFANWKRGTACVYMTQSSGHTPRYWARRNQWQNRVSDRYLLRDATPPAAAKAARPDAKTGYPIRNAALTDVRLMRGFWFDRCETNRTATLAACLKKCNETPRIANFTNAANRARGTFGGIPFDDSDVYKVMEGAAYVLAAHPDPKLEAYVDWFIGQVAQAQERDGYLYTARTLGFVSRMTGPTRWTNLGSSHELYNVGHMYEAAVAWERATGKRNFLDIAVKNANLICRTFGWDDDQLKDTSGHEEIELALCKLYRATGAKKYLEAAKFFLDMRGRKDLRENAGRAGRQDHLPVVEQTEATGHAVRAGYLYTGMADVAALTGDDSYVAAIDRLWNNVVSYKLYLTGGIGARHSYCDPIWGSMYEAFNAPYDLPNDSGESYLETCAAIANILWNERMFLWHGESKYVDVAELALHNGFLSGISLSGTEFFYPNPLASTGGYKRVAWFGCSCCPVNDVRMIPQVPSFAYATDDKGAVYCNLFMEGEASIAGAKFRCETDYPWNGRVKLTVLATAPSAAGFSVLKVRIPGWALGRPVPSDLYGPAQPGACGEVAIAVNGQAVGACPGKDGYVALARSWKAGDVVTMDLPMTVRRIRANPRLLVDQGRLAVMRGPILYCAEGVDNGGRAYAAKLPADVTFAEDTITIGDKTYPALKASNGLKLIPYCLWGNREPGNELQCWFE